MKIFVFWVGVSVLLVYSVGAASGVKTLADTRRGKPQVERGREVFAANCARCHGGDGLGHTTMGEMTEAPNLTDAAWQSRRSNARMIASVANGRGEMPAFLRKLSRQDISAAIAYIRTLRR
ncbi:MAG TPA: c-type cytochrome [Pyrinomonadaceae bacterium]|jgi:cytochrome c oxidase cbb3-type subunit 3|nr:c-type cytochrome [Pyrinomonadaceae bacterium]